MLGGGESRRATVNDISNLSSDNDAPPLRAGAYKSKSVRRRVTVTAGRPSSEALGRPELEGRTQSKSNNSIADTTPRPSLLMKDVFTHMMEEKLSLSQNRIRGSD